MQPLRDKEAATSLKLLSAFVILVGVGSGQAQGDRPFLTGTWVQDIAGTQPGEATVLKIIDNPPLLSVERTSGAQSQPSRSRMSEKMRR